VKAALFVIGYVPGAREEEHFLSAEFGERSYARCRAGVRC